MIIAAGKRQIMVRNPEKQVGRGLLGVSAGRRVHRDFPRVHWLLAGDATANSVPFGAYEFLADIEVAPEFWKLYATAEVWLQTITLSNEEIFQAGYETNGGMCIDQPNECISDIEDPVQMEVEWSKLYSKWGIDHPSIKELINSQY